MELEKRVVGSLPLPVFHFIVEIIADVLYLLLYVLYLARNRIVCFIIFGDIEVRLN